MDEYISREDAINFFENMTWYHVNGRGQLVDGANSDTGLYKAKDVYKGLHDIPAADVVPVVHGKWIPHSEKSREYIGTVLVHVMYDYWLCDTCGYRVENGQPMYNFCPNCGAKMDGKEE